MDIASITASQVIFFILAAVILAGSVMTVVSRKLLHAAVYLLFVLLATAGIYFLLNYHFLAVVQISVYIGGILVLLVFSIYLTSQVGEKMDEPGIVKKTVTMLISMGGAVFCFWVLCTGQFPYADQIHLNEIDMHAIGQSLLGTERYQYLLPFEAISVLLLACIIGGILIATGNTKKED